MEMSEACLFLLASAVLVADLAPGNPEVVEKRKAKLVSALLAG
jgi:hypothetical protein